MKADGSFLALLAVTFLGCGSSTAPEVTPRPAGSSTAAVTGSGSVGASVENLQFSLETATFTAPLISDPPAAPVPAAVVVKWPKNATVVLPQFGVVELRDLDAFVRDHILPLIARRFSPMTVVDDFDAEAARAMGPHAEVLLELERVEARAVKEKDGVMRRGMDVYANVKLRKAGMSGWSLDGGGLLGTCSWPDPLTRPGLPTGAFVFAFQLSIERTNQLLEDSSAEVIVDLLSQRVKAGSTHP